MVQYPDANHPRFGTESRTVRASGLEPSTLRLNIADGSMTRAVPSMLMLHFADGSILQDRTFHAKGRYRGQFDVNKANRPR